MLAEIRRDCAYSAPNDDERQIVSRRNVACMLAESLEYSLDDYSRRLCGVLLDCVEDALFTHWLTGFVQRVGNSIGEQRQQVES